MQNQMLMQLLSALAGNMNAQAARPAPAVMAPAPNKAGSEGYRDSWPDTPNPKPKVKGKRDEENTDTVKLPPVVQKAVTKGPTGYSHAMRQNVGMTDKVPGYDAKASNRTSGMAKRRFMNLFG